MPISVPISPAQNQYIKTKHAELVASGMKSSKAKAQIGAELNIDPCTVGRHLHKTVPPRIAIGEQVVGSFVPHSNIRPAPLPLEFVPPELDYIPHTRLNLNPADIFTPQLSPNIKTYIFTSWEVRTRPDYAFVDCLRQIAKAYDAEMYLTPCYIPDLDFLPNELRLAFKILASDLQLNENIFFKYVETHALSQSPLAGWKGFTDKTAILPGLIKELETFPTDKDCKQLITTGSAGYLTLDSEHYKFIKESPDKAYKERFDSRWNSFRSQKRPIAIASEYVRPSAQIVHILDDKTFLTRRLTMQPDSN